MFHIMQARSWKRRSLTREQIMKSLHWRRVEWNLCVVCVVCERCMNGFFHTVWIFPTGFFPLRGFFHAGV